MSERKSKVKSTELFSRVVTNSIACLSQWMKQKRYSSSTIDTYLSFVRQFFVITGLEPDQITKELIEWYNYRHFIREGKSYATQNQWINAIKLIYIRGGKGKKDRRVPLSAKLLEILRAYYKTSKPKAYLFEGMGGGRYSNRSAMQILKRAAIKSGITRRITLHTLRHSYATHLTNKGVNIQYLPEILGHNSPKTTMLYTHLSGKDISHIQSPLDDMDL